MSREVTRRVLVPEWATRATYWRNVAHRSAVTYCSVVAYRSAVHLLEAVEVRPSVAEVRVDLHGPVEPFSRLRDLPLRPEEPAEQRVVIVNIERRCGNRAGRRNGERNYFTQSSHHGCMIPPTWNTIAASITKTKLDLNTNRYASFLCITFFSIKKTHMNYEALVNWPKN